MNLRIFAFFICIIHLRLSSQQQIILDQSAYNLFITNPANTGTEKGNMSAYYKKSWLSVPGSPEKYAIAINAPSPDKNIGLGFLIDKESAGFTQRSWFLASFRYALKLTARKKLSFGLTGGFQNMTNDLSAIKAESPEEFAGQPQLSRITIPAIGAGIALLDGENFKTGVAVENILQNNFIFREPATNRSYGYHTLLRINLYLQQRFILKKDLFDYTPTLFIRSLNGMPPQVDVVNSFTIHKDFMFALGYRSSNMVFFTGGFSCGNIKLMYSYETTFNQVYIGGGHEIGISYIFGNAVQPKQRETASGTETDEIYEKLQEQEALLNKMTRKTDSLDKNMQTLRDEMGSLKNKQVNEEDVALSFAEMNRTDGIKHQVIKDSQTNLVKDSVKATYQVVLGVYQLATNARDYQKFLERTLSMTTVLVQIQGQPKKYIYVCLTKNYTSIKEAAGALKDTMRTLKTYKAEITKGEPWILQTLKK